jgi:hypothetical protein
MKRVLAASLFSLASFATSQDLASIDRMDASTPRDVQIHLAKAAAPSDVADHATIMILGKKGYETVVHGTNGFTCLVLRERADTLEPECYDAEGSRTTLKVDLYLEERRAQGIAEEQIKAEIERGYTSGKFKAPSKPGIVYMLSPYNRVFDPDQSKVIAFPGHLMFYAPYATAETVGKGEGAPYIVSPGKPNALLIVVPK